MIENYWPGALSENEVHVWHLVADAKSQEMQNYADCLSALEKEKSNRFKFEKDQRRYITRHVFLRKVLACYLGVNADQIKFREDDYGKPFIDEPANIPDLQFNMSKSANHVLVAVTNGRLIGCDIEKHNSKLDYKAIIENYFSVQEINFILDDNNEQLNFFDYWAVKEAYIKARGEGLSFELDKFTLHIDANDNVSMLENLQVPQDVEQWRIKRLHPAAGYSAAICVNDDISSIKEIDIKV